MVISSLKKWRGRAGDVFAVQLKADLFVFGQICPKKDVAFFAITSPHPIGVEEILAAPILFRVPMARGGKKGRAWYYLANVEPTGALALDVPYRVQPVGSNQIYKMVGWNQTPISEEEAKSLEPMAWWFCEHLEDRLMDWYLGRPNIWSQSIDRVRHYDEAGQEIRDA